MAESNKTINILELTTLVYALLTFLGYSFIDSYFSHWGIHIYSFLDATEVLHAFLKNIDHIVPILVLFYLYSFWIQSSLYTTSIERYSLVRDGDKISFIKFAVIFIVFYILLKNIFLPLINPGQ